MQFQYWEFLCFIFQYIFFQCHYCFNVNTTFHITSVSMSVFSPSTAILLSKPMFPFYISWFTVSVRAPHYYQDFRTNRSGSLERHAGDESLKVLRWLNFISVNKGPLFLCNFWFFFIAFLLFIASKHKGHLLRRLWLLGSASIDP